MLTTIKALASNTKVVYFVAGVAATVSARMLINGTRTLSRAVKEQLAEQAAVKAAYDAEHPDTPENGPVEPTFTPVDEPEVAGGNVTQPAQ